MLSRISQIKYVVQAICVRLQVSDPFIGTSSAKHPDHYYVCTFKVYPTTKFSEIKKAACEFWNKIEQKYILTDEYYNNLASYATGSSTECTVMNFFKGYTPLNAANEAIVYLVQANQKVRDLHKL